MKLFTITSQDKKSIPDLIMDACSSKGIDYIEVDESRTNILDLTQNSSERDIVYRVSLTDSAKILEKILLAQDLKSIYTNNYYGIAKIDNVIEASIIHQFNEIKIPKTIYSVSNNYSFLDEYIDYLGGFPIVIKVKGGMKGIGVIKVDSKTSLKSILDYFKATKAQVILREFIDVGEIAFSYRCIVLGSNVIFTYKNTSTHSDDFRSNVDQSKRIRKEVKLDEGIELMVKKAVQTLGLEFAGVDLIEDQDGNIYLIEVNSPFNFTPVVKTLNFPLHQKLVDFLSNKSTSTSYKS